MKISVVTPSIRPEGLKVVQECLEQQTLKDFEWLTEIGLPKKDGHDLNAAFNRMLRRAKGDLVVFWQDYVKAGPDCLQKFWDAYEKDKKIFFTAPVGKTSDWKEVKWDWRKHFTEVASWTYWEIDLGAAPLSALKEIGGFDEELDKHWSFDNVNVAMRADLAGYKFANLTDNQAVAWDHDAFLEHPFRKKYNPDFHNQRLDDIRRGNAKIANL